METKIFLNLPVKDLNRSISFFTQLGFSFNPQFTNDKGTCLVIGKNINAMLLTEEFYKTFTHKEICNTATTNEVIISVQIESRDKVNQIIEDAVKNGATEYLEAKDYGWMYYRSFFDLDGHHWEFSFINEDQIPDKM
ncbi:glyoxalase/bleomycin resistance/extradiol dioxygenase family protein [Flavobacterium sp. JLP]|uniref:VOC family protein n=1 Tax=unclassified Flavobacterium TaxID=196869 RepID=UPI00188B115C|nr:MULTISPECIES: VOC family protein [unclassified Flavobacterium]MBF4494747.1 glyoxalase/bleomycin resistance/extradiol dioxygenase family protein [Flavobacterium sp. MR2016-29]MBF4508528.1 glyoxalase/bleomycin resistance/extradiol dioxygenase family protein [Flavobacterium sp. JLP]